jgi:hypothetical protein
MARFDPTSPIPPEVHSALNAVRGRIHTFVWADALAMVTILAGASFWLGLGLDWWLEPRPTVRAMALVFLGVVLAGAIYHLLFRRLAVPISDASLALLLERHDRRLGDHVATVISLSADKEIARRYHPQLVAQTSASAARAVRQIDVTRLFNYRPLWTRCAVAGAIILSIVLFAVFAGDTFGFWMERLALSDQNWPRRVRLEVVGFPPNDSGERVQTIARDDEFELTVRADLGGEHVAPERVSIRFRLPDGRSGRDYLARIGNSDPTRDQYQSYRYTFKNVRTSMYLEVVGGDDQIRDLQLRVVDRPELVAVEADCTYPAYLGRAGEKLIATGGLRVPVGSELTLRATASKDLESATAESTERGPLSARAPSSLAEEILFDYGQLASEDTLLIHLTDSDGIESRHPYRLVITAIPDELPQVAVSLNGIGSAITPDARIPFAGQLRDDYGLREAWFEYSVDSGPNGRQPLERDPNGRTELKEIGVFDLRASPAAGAQSMPRLQPGQKLALAVAASDHCDLESGPRVGTSQRYVLEVVTPADLLLLVERRELSLRQRFESTYEKVTDTRAMLARVDFSTSDPSTDVTASPSGGDTSESDEAPSDTSDRALALRRLRVSGAEQNITQSADEVLNVAEGFENLHDQLVNNRIENRELMDRLKVDIANPLLTISRERMPALEAQLEALQEFLADGEQGAEQVETSIALADAVLAEMKHVLDRMLELETYNEVVALLREIISDQRELNERTKEQRQQSLRSLLED